MFWLRNSIKSVLRAENGATKNIKYVIHRAKHTKPKGFWRKFLVWIFLFAIFIDFCDFEMFFFCESLADPLCFLNFLLKGCKIRPWWKGLRNCESVS